MRGKGRERGRKKYTGGRWIVRKFGRITEGEKKNEGNEICRGYTQERVGFFVSSENKLCMLEKERK